MTKPKSLKNRIALNFALFGGLVSLVIAIVIYFAAHNLEARLIDDTLVAELDDYILRRERNPQSLPEHTATISAYVVSQSGGTGSVPHEIKILPVGFHDIVINQEGYRAAVREVKNQRFIVLYDTGALERRETWYLALLTISVMIISLTAAFAGKWLAAKIIAPVSELANRVAQLHPEDEPTPLVDEFSWVEIRQLARDFDIYLKQLHDFILREQLFTGDISHELRTPVSVILGATELMLSDPSINEVNIKRLERIHRSASEMGEVSAAILSLSREKGDAVTQSRACDIISIAEEIIERYSNLYKNKPVQLELKVVKPGIFKVDHAIMFMILSNLVRNALSFTEQGYVRILLEKDTIRIEDTGPGLPGLDTEQLFKPFVTSRRHSGTGIGLSLVWRLCEKQGWKINLGNREGGGTFALLQFHPE